jgi:dUTP pyrophosphatase
MKLLIFTQNEELKDLYSKRSNFTEDSGIDLYCPKDIIIPSRTQGKIDFEIKCQMTKEDKFYAYFLLPRSSIVKTPLRMSNSIGLIDSTYTGSIMAFVDNISDKEYIIKKGDKIFQIAHSSLCPLQYELTNELRKTERGEGGFGSTNN